MNLKHFSQEACNLVVLVDKPVNAIKTHWFNKNEHLAWVDVIDVMEQRLVTSTFCFYWCQRTVLFLEQLITAKPENTLCRLQFFLMGSDIYIFNL